MSVKKIGVVLITIAIFGMGVWFLIGNSPYNIVEINSSRTLNAEGIRTIDVKSALSDVKIIPTNGNTIEVQIHGKTTYKWKDDYEIVASTDNGQLTIELKEKTPLRFFDIYNKLHLSLLVPSQSFSLIKVTTDTESIQVQDINVERFQLASDTGNINVKEAAGAFDIYSDSGHVNLDLTEIKHPITAKTNAGNITVKVKERPSALQTSLQSDSGKIIIDIPDAANGTIGMDGPMVSLLSDSGDVMLTQ